MKKILDGKLVSSIILEDIKREIDYTIHNAFGKELNPPHLAVILIGDNPASETYVKNKIIACNKAGINHSLHRLDNNVTNEQLKYQIETLNKSGVDGFFIQLPVPKHININEMLNIINPDKDVDGFTPINFGKMALGQDSLKPATPYGILKLIKHYKIETKGKHVVIVGRSNIVGKPLSIMLGNDFNIGRATCTSCDINTPRELLLDELKRADIVIIAVGSPNFLTGDMIKEGAIVIDVGINKVDNKIVGDCEFDSVYEKCSMITPVPGGVGPMTISALMVNTLNSWKKRYF